MRVPSVELPRPGSIRAARGGVRFVADHERATLQAPIDAAAFLPVEIALPDAGGRGRLRETIESAIELALARRDAPPPSGTPDAAGLDAVLANQLLRAQATGASGLSLYMPHLRSLASTTGLLDPDDSAVLRWWFAAARERPILLLMNEANRTLEACGAPVRIEQLAGSEVMPTDLGSCTSAERSAAIPDALRSVCAAAPAAAQSEEVAVDGPAKPSRSTCLQWIADLDAARGPKPLSMVERLFVSRYVPLADALARGHADPSARATLASWGASFAKSYSEAFGAFRVTGKRPLMVLDVPQLASRIARLHGAKTVQLLLVDAMRFDLGLRVHERVRKDLAAYARCTERFLLWAALPTNTGAQLSLLAYGPDALTQSRGLADHDDTVSCGRSATILRRVRVGTRDLLKLDVVEARLQDAGADLASRLDAVADEIASVIATHIKSLAPRTLLFLFGDHGFRLHESAEGTGPGISGGAAPEEVLVPAFTWLVGDVH